MLNMARYENPELSRANGAFASGRFAEAVKYYRLAFAAGADGIAEKLRYGLSCLFSGEREEFNRIDREIAQKHSSDDTPHVGALLRRYAALSLALGTCAMLSACDRVTYPYEKEKKKPQSEIVTPTPVIHKYGGPIPVMKYGAPIPISKYSAPIPVMKYGAPIPISKYGAPPVVSQDSSEPQVPLFPAPPIGNGEE